jgi:hypothetical protein
MREERTNMSQLERERLGVVRGVAEGRPRERGSRSGRHPGEPQSSSTSLPGKSFARNAESPQALVAEKPPPRLPAFRRMKDCRSGQEVRAAALLWQWRRVVDSVTGCIICI